MLSILASEIKSIYFIFIFLKKSGEKRIEIPLTQAEDLSCV